MRQRVAADHALGPTADNGELLRAQACADCPTAVPVDQTTIDGRLGVLPRHAGQSDVAYGHHGAYDLLLILEREQPGGAGMVFLEVPHLLGETEEVVFSSFDAAEAELSAALAEVGIDLDDLDQLVTAEDMVPFTCSGEALGTYADDVLPDNWAVKVSPLDSDDGQDNAYAVDFALWGPDGDVVTGHADIYVSID